MLAIHSGLRIFGKPFPSLTGDRNTCWINHISMRLFLYILSSHLQIILSCILFNHDASIIFNIHRIYALRIYCFYIKHVVPIGQLHLINIKIIFILNNTSSFSWVQTNRMVTCGTFLKFFIFKDEAALWLRYMIIKIW
jgi:hypothetical protein